LLFGKDPALRWRNKSRTLAPMIRRHLLPRGWRMLATWSHGSFPPFDSHYTPILILKSSK
jgi:hypothetical protein